MAFYDSRQDLLNQMDPQLPDPSQFPLPGAPAPTAPMPAPTGPPLGTAPESPGLPPGASPGWESQAPSPGSALQSPAAPSFNYDAARDAWMGGGYSLDEAGVGQWAQQYGVPYSGGQVVTLPNGAQLDIIGNFRGPMAGRRANWTGLGQYASDYGQAGGAGAGAGTGAGGSVGGAGGGAGIEGSLRDVLLRLMGRSDEVNPDDPSFQAQFLPLRTQLERNAQRMREQAVERAAAEGSSFGGRGVGGEIGSIQEMVGEQTGRALGGMLGQEIQRRRDQLMRALQLANAIGARDQAATLQERLAQLDQAFRYAQLQQNQGQWNDQYGLNRSRLQYDIDRDAVLSQLSG